MKKNEKVTFNFFGLRYECENPTNRGILITLIIAMLALAILF